MPSPSLRDAKLDALYQNTPGAVTFVDESYRSNPFPGERPFYSMSAVTYDKGHLDVVREVLTDIAGGLYWHTTEANELGRHDDIHRMTSYIARRAEWNIVTIETTIPQGDNGIIAARSTCLAAITREVSRGTGPSAVRLIVADNNLDNELNRADQQVIARLRSNRDINPNVTLYHGRMGREPMLWAADVVSWSAYRNVAVDDGRWIAPLREVLTVLDARTGKALNMKQPQAAAATPEVQPSTPHQGPQTAVASLDSLVDAAPESTPVARSYKHGTTVLDDLAGQVARQRRELGAKGIVEGNQPSALLSRARRLLVDDDTPDTPQDPPTAKLGNQGPQL